MKMVVKTLQIKNYHDQNLGKMLKYILLYSSRTGQPIITINQQTRWLRSLFVEGITMPELINYERIVIDVSQDWETFENQISDFKNEIIFLCNFDFITFDKLTGSFEKSMFLLDYLVDKLTEFDLGMPVSIWHKARSYCIKQNFTYRKLQRKKPKFLRHLSLSIRLYCEVDIFQFRLFVLIRNKKTGVFSFKFINTDEPQHIENFNQFEITTNEDNSINIVDKARYSRKFNITIENILALEDVQIPSYLENKLLEGAFDNHKI